MDKAQIEVRGGRGGNGCISFQILSPGRKGPSGGTGGYTAILLYVEYRRLTVSLYLCKYVGKGGNVYIVGDSNLSGLNFQTFHFNAGDGGHGSGKNATGRNGKVAQTLSTSPNQTNPTFNSNTRTYLFAYRVVR